MKNVKITAVSAAEMEDVNAYILVFFNDAENPTDGLEIQRALEFDDQDIQYKMDTYCLITPQGKTSYGGVESCILEGKKLTLKFRDEAKRQLGIDGYIFDLDLQEDEIQFAIESLRRVFEGDRQSPALSVSI